MTPSPLLNSEEARAYLGGMSERKLRGLVAAGEIPATHVGGRNVRFLRAALDDFLLRATDNLRDDLRDRLAEDAARLLHGAPPVSEQTAARVAAILAGAAGSEPERRAS